MKFFNLTNIFPKVINSEVLVLQLQCVDFSSRTGKLMIGVNFNSESLLNGSKMVHKTVVLLLSFSTQCNHHSLMAFTEQLLPSIELLPQ